MNIREHVRKAIYGGLPARFDMQAGAAGVLFEDQEFIDFWDLGYNSALGYYRLSKHPQAVSDCSNENPETIHLLAGSDGDGQQAMYVWANVS